MKVLNAGSTDFNSNLLAAREMVHIAASGIMTGRREISAGLLILFNEGTLISGITVMQTMSQPATPQSTTLPEAALTTMLITGTLKISCIRRLEITTIGAVQASAAAWRLAVRRPPMGTLRSTSATATRPSRAILSPSCLLG